MPDLSLFTITIQSFKLTGSISSNEDQSDWLKIIQKVNSLHLEIKHHTIYSNQTVFETLLLCILTIWENFNILNAQFEITGSKLIRQNKCFRRINRLNPENGSRLCLVSSFPHVILVSKSLLIFTEKWLQAQS